MKIDVDKYKVELGALQDCRMTFLEALKILAIALEYGKPNRGKWRSNT